MKILVIGEPMIDIYHSGSCNRVSPEAPIPVVKISSTNVYAGGAANVVRNLEELGAEVETIYPPGAGKPFNLCPIKHRLMVGDTQLARWDEDDSLLPLVFPKDFPTYLMGIDAVVISDYGKGAFTPEIKQRLIQATTTFTGQVFVDSKASPAEWDPRFTFFPNSAEFTAHFDAYNQMPHVVHTLGAGGMEYLYHGVRKAFYPAFAKNLRSVIGAGDTVIAAFAYAMACGATPEWALSCAAVKAAEKVERPFTL